MAIQTLFFFLLWLLQAFFFDLTASSQSRPFVTCALTGQLGNQLHQVATTLAYGWDNNLDPIFPDLSKKNGYSIDNKSTIFRKLNSSPLPRSVKHHFHHYINFDKVPIPFKKDQKLHGYFQTWEYYHHHRDQLISIFEPEADRVEKIKEKYQSLIEHPCAVAVHVRTFNKSWNTYIPFVGLEYYEKAFLLFPEDTLFVIFSDRINWCKKHFEKFNRPMIFIENEHHLDDFYLMSMLKHNIIGNSSFSWWAAYLNTNKDKIVVGPNYFINPIIHKTHHHYNALLPDWIVLDIDYNSPYPEDITHYDTFSKSSDTQ